MGKQVEKLEANGESSSTPAARMEDPASIAAASSQHPDAVGFAFTATERDRLRLLNHYTLHTSKSITEITIPEDQDQSFWSTVIPELALDNDFLLYGLLGISALHLALLCVSRQKHTVLAIKHHNLSVALFRPLLSNMTADIYDAVFASTCITTLSSFGLHRLLRTESDPIANLRQVLILLRSSGLFVTSDAEALKRSRWQHFIAQKDFPSSEEALPDDMEAMFSTLLHRIPTTTTTTTPETEAESLAAKTAVYTLAIKTLRDNFLFALAHPRAQLALTLFPIMSPSKFWVMVGQDDQLALAILGNYGVVLWWLRGNVWIEGWGEEVVDAVRKDLPLQWQECIAWAVKTVGGSCKLQRR